MEEICRLLDYYVLPESEVLEYQLHRVLCDLDSQVRRMLADPYHEGYKHLYLFHGHSLEKVRTVY